MNIGKKSKLEKIIGFDIGAWASTLLLLMNKFTSSVTLSRENYNKLRQLGYAEETMDDVVGRVLEVVDQVTEESR